MFFQALPHGVGRHYLFIFVLLANFFAFQIRTVNGNLQATDNIIIKRFAPKRTVINFFINRIILMTSTMTLFHPFGFMQLTKAGIRRQKIKEIASLKQSTLGVIVR